MMMEIINLTDDNMMEMKQLISRNSRNFLMQI